jgi:MscS family membrane protein
MTKAALFLALLLLLAPLRVSGQSLPTGQAEGTAKPAPAADPLGRGTPRGTVSGLIAAAEQGQLDRAADYLESGLRAPERHQLARKLWVILDRKLRASPDRLSNDPGGNPDDGLPTRDRIGLIESPSGSVEILLDRVQRAQGEPIWLFSASVLSEIPRLYDELEPPWIERHVPAWLRVPWLSLPLYRWLAFLLFIPLVFGLAALGTRWLTRAINPLFRRLTREQHDQTLVTAGPLRLLLLSLFFHVGALVGLSLALRHFWQRVAETLMVIALGWLAIRLADVLAGLSLTRLQRAHRSGDIALIRLINRLVKAGTVIIALLALLYLADVDLTAALTGLGVGGIAIGFGAQKTIENLFGGIMIISDKPVSVGDVCRAGEYFGTVEDIGIRSTRIRTLDRTVVAVPNGQLAMMSLENVGARDQIRFQHTVALSRQTTTAQLRSVLVGVRRLLAEHPRIDAASARVRFIRMTPASFDLEIFAYVMEREHVIFLAVQEDLLLAIMDILDASGTSLASPVALTSLADGGLVSS